MSNCLDSALSRELSRISCKCYFKTIYLLDMVTKNMDLKRTIILKFGKWTPLCFICFAVCHVDMYFATVFWHNFHFLSGSFCFPWEILEWRISADIQGHTADISSGDWWSSLHFWMVSLCFLLAQLRTLDTCLQLALQSLYVVGCQDTKEKTETEKISHLGR